MLNVQDKKMLDELYQGIHMGKQALIEYMEKLDSVEIKTGFQDYINEYATMQMRVEDIYSKNNEEIPNPKMMADVGLWSTVQMYTLTDKRDSHVVEKVIEGTYKGNVMLMKLLNSYPDAAEDIRRLTKDVIDDGEKFVYAFEKHMKK